MIMKRKTLYESPLLQEMSLELEQVLCASVSNTTKEMGFTSLDEIDKSSDWLTL